MKKIIRKIVSLAFTLLIITSMILPFTIESMAASGKVTVYVPTSATIKSVRNGTKSTETYKIKYNKKGLPTTIYEPDGVKFVFKYNKKGFLAKTNRSTNTGAWTKIKVNKDGFPIKLSYYDNSVTSVKYRKNGRPKSAKSKLPDGNYVCVSFDKYGNRTSSKYQNDTRVFSTTTFKNKLNKKGNVVKQIQKIKGYDNATTITVKYKYDKHGNIKNKTTKLKRKDGTESYKVTYKYKKIKVSKKYEKIIKTFAWKATYDATGAINNLFY